MMYERRDSGRGEGERLRLEIAREVPEGAARAGSRF